MPCSEAFLLTSSEHPLGGAARTPFHEEEGLGRELLRKLTDLLSDADTAANSLGCVVFFHEH